MAEEGDFMNLETYLEDYEPKKLVINEAMLRVCDHYKTVGQYEDCLNLLIK